MPSHKDTISQGPISKRHRPTELAVARRRGWMIACLISSVFFYFCGVFTVFIFWVPREAIFGVVGGLKWELIHVKTVPLWDSQLFHETFYRPTSSHYSEHWNETYPPHGGVFRHKPHYQLEEMQAEMVVFHQLHCIDDLECTFAGGIDTRVCAAGMSIPKSRVDHCLEYLRRTVKCAVDTHLEHEQNLVIKVGDHDTTFNHSRVCRNFEDVRNLVREIELYKEPVRLDTLTLDESKHVPIFN